MTEILAAILVQSHAQSHVAQSHALQSLAAQSHAQALADLAVINLNALRQIAASKLL